jgi:hypothetical protein
LKYVPFLCQTMNALRHFTGYLVLAGLVLGLCVSPHVHQHCHTSDSIDLLKITRVDNHNLECVLCIISSSIHFVQRPQAVLDYNFPAAQPKLSHSILFKQDPGTFLGLQLRAPPFFV